MDERILTALGGLLGGLGGFGIFQYLLGRRKLTVEAHEHFRAELLAEIERLRTRLTLLESERILAQDRERRLMDVVHGLERKLGDCVESLERHARRRRGPRVTEGGPS